MRAFAKTKGAVSIFLVIILVPMMTVSSLFVDAGKVKLGEGVANSAGELALNTALTDYDTKLKDFYGLFATAQDTSELFDSLEDYYRDCITSSGVTEEDADSYVDMIMSQLGLVAEGNDIADILNMELIDFSVSKRTDASLANAAVLKKQIVEFMKYRAPINTGLSFLSSIKSFSTLSEQTELVDKRQKYYEAESEVMEDAKEAWDYIDEYNKSKLIKSDSYLSDMQDDFNNKKKYRSGFENNAEKIIMNISEAQNNVTYPYSIENKELESEGTKIQIPVFYTNKNKTSARKNYTEYTTYSDSKKSTADDLKKALEGYYETCKEVDAVRKSLETVDSKTRNLKDLVKKWVTCVQTVYDKYNELHHTADYAGKGVMKTKGKLCGSNTEETYASYYEENVKWFEDKINGNGSFNEDLSHFNSLLQQADEASIQEDIVKRHDKINEYKTTIENAAKNLRDAVGSLEDVVKGIKDLKDKKDDWKEVADDKNLKSTAMAKQDLAEIRNLSTYLKEDEVKKLIKRLNNIILKLDENKREIDSYTFFGKKITNIDSYETLSNLLKEQIGEDNLKKAPTDQNELKKQAEAWIQDKYVIGNKVDVSWENQSGTQANLIKDKLNFYSFLSTHFHDASEKEKPKEGEELYDSLKDKSEEAATDTAKESDSGNISDSSELKDLNGPSSEALNNSETASAGIETEDVNNVAQNTSSSLGSMFAGLSDMAEGLRDNLYISDYILGMFSYDTIEKEYEKEYEENNPGKKSDGNIQSLTLEPINKDNNFAYGKEIEYIIYGGSNAGNLAKSYGSIFGIRFGFNVIYAFTDSSIRETALAIATPISAATMGVIPAPLIQAAIIIGITCCESAIDLMDIKNGKSVPLFKSKDSWHCSVQGLINEVKEGAGTLAKEFSSDLVDETAEELGKVLDMTDEELDQYLDKGADSLTNKVSAAYDALITRHANIVIQKLVTLVYNAKEECALNGSDMVEYVSKGLDQWLEEEAKAIGTSSDLAYIVKEEAVRIIKDQFITKIIDVLETAGSKASEKINNIVTSMREKIAEKISSGCDKVKDYKSQMILKVKNSIGEGAQSVKNTINEKIDGIFGNSSEGNTDNTGIASLLSFSYSDYLRLFLMIGLYTNEEGILLRTGDVIQANMAKKITKNDKYSLSQSAVYVDVSATVMVKPTLLALPIFSGVEGNPVTNQNWYTIEYQSVKGY